jgi:hypothetical protein
MMNLSFDKTVFTTLLVAAIATGCSTNKICYDYIYCSNKVKIKLDVLDNGESDAGLILKITNNRAHKIVLKDSIVILFYGFNQGLKHPYHDSLDKAENKTIDYVAQSSPVTLVAFSLSKPLSIASGSYFTYILNKQALISAVNNRGNADNKFQLKNGFQLFITSNLPKGRVIHLASNIFSIK